MHVHAIYDWAFDIMHEFVFQFQGFRQYRTSSSGKRKEEDWKILRPNLKKVTLPTKLYWMHTPISLL